MASHLSLKDVRGERTLVKPSWGALVTKVSPQDEISGEPTLPSGNTPLRRRLVGFRAVAVNSLASPVSFFGFGYLLSGSPVCDPPPHIHECGPRGTRGGTELSGGLFLTLVFLCVDFLQL